jgi:hydroxymethylglutaryl-CoA reductase (NADPH)
VDRRADDLSVSSHAKLREVKTHVVGPMCHVLWAWTTGDACGPNMMTRNSYALNMGYVMQQAPVKPERAILEANMGGDKKPSFEFFQSGHGKTVIAEATLTEDASAGAADDDRRSAWLSWAGDARGRRLGMQSSRSRRRRDRRDLRRTGRPGMVGTSLDGHGTGRRVRDG